MDRYFRHFRWAAFVVLAIFIWAAPAAGKETWIKLRTPNFVLVGNAGEKQMRDVALRLEQFRNTFTRLFPALKYDTPVRPNVLVFNSLKSFAPFKPGNVVGYYQSGPDVDYIAMTVELNPGQDPFNVIFHEYTHLLVRNSLLRNVPAWFNEGLAEYYSTFAAENDQKFTLGKVIPWHLYTLNQESCCR